ncbi:MAG TPA: AbrB/MazE/SpoVT family DNA-binding domain-containing protein [Candidatus Thermoplasmatota archaeon]|nr:AbrB/MazE/SpoVT family DNA-binding domain-containing protein [Candidatus Thermoplasmatota archaeon]
MAEGAPETRVTEGFSASIPAEIRRKLGIEAGDVLVWEVKDSKLAVRVRKRRSRGFADFEPFDFGRRTRAAEDHDEVL